MLLGWRPPCSERQAFIGVHIDQVVVEQAREPSVTHCQSNAAQQCVFMHRQRRRREDVVWRGLSCVAWQGCDLSAAARTSAACVVATHGATNGRLTSHTHRRPPRSGCNGVLALRWVDLPRGPQSWAGQHNCASAPCVGSLEAPRLCGPAARPVVWHHNHRRVHTRA